MGKNNKVKANESSQRTSKKEQTLSKKKQKRDAKPRPEEHLDQIPFRLREIMKSKERMKIGASKLKKMKKAMAPKPDAGDAGMPDIPVPHFRRRRKESEKAYLRRMGQETQHVLFLTKNQVDRQPELEQQDQEQPADQRKSEKKREFDRVRLQRLQKKKTERKEQKEEKEQFTDKVHFGEVAMAPPSLTAKPKKAPSKSQGAPKGLLLNSLLGHTSVSTAKPSMARQRMMEEERERVVQAYRHLKKLKQERQGAQGAGLGRLQDPQ
ncbi:coiled-coil domain-containing protein 137 [Megalops cyprinoides]|uniref:coiled-coil domain-containing protein 137 n=1 Tax=Megalops cyprinoides TaxID=118141 RepID=UPI0018643ABF|nr:coiled-coil domain-containing protein 137 [Megalops cyprinoides]